MLVIFFFMFKCGMYVFYVMLSSFFIFVIFGVSLKFFFFDDFFYGFLGLILVMDNFLLEGVMLFIWMSEVLLEFFFLLFILFCCFINWVGFLVMLIFNIIIFYGFGIKDVDVYWSSVGSIIGVMDGMVVLSVNKFF